MMSTLLRGGSLVLPTGLTKADLRIDGGKIAEIGPDLPQGDSTVLDVTGKLLFPGFIDTHTHFEMNKGLPNETADDWVTGTKAAVAGGTTTVLDFAESQRGHSLASALSTWHGRADGRASCNYGFHMTIKDWDQRIKDELPQMTAAGITSYKVYFAYDNLRISDKTAYEVIQAVGAEGGTLGCHCENGDLVTEGIKAQKAAGNLSPAAHPLSRPPVVEAEAVERWLALSEMAGYPVNIVHLSTLRGLEAVRAARKRGQELYVESCPQYFLLNDDKYLLPGFESAKYMLSPPLRSPENSAALWQALKNGEIDTMGTDHCSFDFDGVKTLGRDDFSKIPNGMPGVEHRAVLMYSEGVAKGNITEVELARYLSEQPAKLFGMYPQKGVLAVGSDADIVVWDPQAKWTISAADQVQAVDYNPYEGLAVIGKAAVVFLNGEIAAEDGRVTREKLGRYVHRGSAQFWRR